VRVQSKVPEAVIAALEGADDAEPRMRASLLAWHSAEFPLDQALTALCAMRVLSDPSRLESEVTSARAYLEGLGATSLLRRFDAASA